MSVNIKSALNRIYQDLKPDLLKTFDESPRLWPQFATEIPTRSKSTMFAWLGNHATVREWKGPRIAKNIATRSWEVTTKKWEMTFEFERDQVEDDLEGVAESAVQQARQMGGEFAAHEDLLMAQVLEAGISAECHDGQFFFDTDHPIDVDGVTSGVFDNDRTLALNHANFDTVNTAQDSLKRENGMPLVMPGGKLLVVPPALGLTAKQIVDEGNLTPANAIGLYGTTGPSKNPLAGAARVVVNPYLTDTSRWYLLACGGYIKPLMFLRRRPLEIAETDETDLIYFMEEKWMIGGSARYDASYTLPQLAFTSKP